LHVGLVEWRYLCVVISMMLMWNAIDIVEYDRRRSGLLNAPLDMGGI
jgi:hypothetical protein